MIRADQPTGASVIPLEPLRFLSLREGLAPTGHHYQGSDAGTATEGLPEPSLPSFQHGRESKEAVIKGAGGLEVVCEDYPCHACQPFPLRQLVGFTSDSRVRRQEPQARDRTGAVSPTCAS